MRTRIIGMLILTVLLGGCGLLGQRATPSDAEMATQVAQILTAMPTPTAPPLEPTPTQPLPTVVLTEEPTVAPPAETPTPLPIEPTATPPAYPPPETVVPTATATVTVTTQPTPTFAFTPPATDPVLKLGNATWTDNMDNDRNWPTGADQYTSVEFRDGVMRLTGLTTTDGWRMTWPKVADFYLEATFRTGECKGSDRYGLFFRVPILNTPDRGYLFGLACDGKYALRRWDASVGTRGEMITLVNWKASDAINAGPNQVNRLGVMAIRDRYALYVNGVLLTEVRDDRFLEGYFGVFVGARETENFTIQVDQIRYWENPRP